MLKRITVRRNEKLRLNEQLAVPGLSNVSLLNKLKGVKLTPPKPVTPKLPKPFRPTPPATFKAKHTVTKGFTS